MQAIGGGGQGLDYVVRERGTGQRVLAMQMARTSLHGGGMIGIVINVDI